MVWPSPNGKEVNKGTYPELYNKNEMTVCACLYRRRRPAACCSPWECPLARWAAPGSRGDRPCSTTTRLTLHISAQVSRYRRLGDQSIKSDHDDGDSRGAVVSEAVRKDL
jgi:hypothetical protein